VTPTIGKSEKKNNFEFSQNFVSSKIDLFFQNTFSFFFRTSDDIFFRRFSSPSAQFFFRRNLANVVETEIQTQTLELADTEETKSKTFFFFSKK